MASRGGKAKKKRTRQDGTDIRGFFSDRKPKARRYATASNVAKRSSGHVAAAATKPTEDSASSSNCRGKGEPNAFAMMMANAKCKQRQEVFSLHFSEEGEFSCRWFVVYDGKSSGRRPENYAEWSHLKGVAAWQTTVTEKRPPFSKPIAVHLLTNIPCVETNDLLDTKLYNRLTVGQLKSALQKNVRRRRPEQACVCAMDLILRSFTQFIRRIIIIVLEDSVLHPSLPELTWLLVATAKGYAPSKKLIGRCLEIVWEVANCEYQDPLSSLSDTGPLEPEKIDDVHEERIEIFLRSLSCRRRFGGMKGDMRMLDTYSHLWMARLSSQPVPVDPPTGEKSWLHFIAKSNSLEGTEKQKMCHIIDDILVRKRVLTAPDIPLAAIDFHCVPGIIDTVQNTAGKGSKLGTDVITLREQIQNTIWFFASSISKKCPVAQIGGKVVDINKDRKAALRQLWESIKRQCWAFQRAFIRARFGK